MSAVRDEAQRRGEVSAPPPTGRGDLAPTGSLAVARPRGAGQLRELVRRFRRNPGAVVGLVVLAVVVLVTIAAPLLAPADPNRMGAGPIFNRPGPPYWLGTDQFGRDILSRILFGGQISLRLGLLSVSIATVAGVLLGLVSGYYGAWIDLVLMRFIDILLAFPGILLALSVVAILGPGLNNAMVAVGVAAIPSYTRVVRGSVLSARASVYVDAARVVGCSDRRIMFRHILPNVLAPVIVLSTLGMATAIITGTSLSFLGLGAQPPSPEWGAMLSGGRDHLRSAWWISTFPGLAIMLVVLAMNVVGDGLRDALDPRLKV
jgi:peptide/nickel transport system permease protein